MWGHKPSYWKRLGAREKEIFANLFALQHNQKAYDIVKKIIPRTVEQFEKKMLELERS